MTKKPTPYPSRREGRKEEVSEKRKEQGERGKVYILHLFNSLYLAVSNVFCTFAIETKTRASAHAFRGMPQRKSEAAIISCTEGSTHVAKGTDRRAEGWHPQASEVATAGPTECDESERAINSRTSYLVPRTSKNNH